MGNKFCRVGQRLFSKYGNAESKLTQLARRAKPDAKKISAAKDEYSSQVKKYREHTYDCDTCTWI
jgi:hypothetical protein